MTVVTVGIGIPGSGKTTFLGKDLNESFYICADDIRKELTGNASDQGRNNEVWELLYERVHDILMGEDSLVIDVTNTRRSDRRKMIEFCHEHGAEVHGIWFDTPLDVCKERNALRERVVPEHVLDRMHRQLVEWPPSLEDGFDRLHKITEIT